MIDFNFNRNYRVGSEHRQQSIQYFNLHVMKQIHGFRTANLNVTLSSRMETIDRSVKWLLLPPETSLFVDVGLLYLGLAEPTSTQGHPKSFG